MHIVGIMGSPRRNSNTEILLDAALSAAVAHGATTQKVVVCELDIHPCIECYRCEAEGRCAVRDDMSGLYDALVAADRIVVASPVFFYGFSAQTKALIDRCQALWMRRYVLKSWCPDVESRRGALISVGATKGPRLFDGILLTAKYFFDAVGVRDFDQLLVRGVDGRAQVRELPDQVEEAAELGARLSTGSAGE